MSEGIQVFSLASKTALITGATGHLGRAMTEGLAQAGAHVLVNGRDPQRVDQAVSALRARGLSAESAVFDITDEHAVAGFFKARAGGSLHVLINNAYVGGAGTVESSEGRSYAASYGIAMVAAQSMVRNALPLLRRSVREQADASIINIASMYALVSPDQRIYESAADSNPPFYGAAKAALLQWTRYAACELGREGIRVNAISPGAFPSSAVQSSKPEFIQRLRAKVPMGRIGSPDELKGAVLFLGSSASSYVNGSNLVVDGGWTCW